VCLFHSQTRKVQQRVHCIHSLLANSLYPLYKTQSNILLKKDYKISLFFNIERESFLPLQWYGGAIIAIPANSPLFVSSVCVYVCVCVHGMPEKYDLLLFLYAISLRTSYREG